MNWYLIMIEKTSTDMSWDKQFPFRMFHLYLSDTLLVHQNSSNLAEQKISALVSHLWLCWSSRTMPCMSPCWPGWWVLPFGAMETFRHRPLPRAMSTSWPSEGWDLGWCLRLLLSLRATQLPEVWLATCNHAATRAVLIWMACAVTRAMAVFGYQWPCSP